MKKKFVEEPDVWLVDEKFFKDKKEHNYSCKCYDGYAEGVLIDEDDEDKNAPKKIVIKYPTLASVKKNTKAILEFRGYYDRSHITYGDVMMYYGEISKR